MQASNQQELQEVLRNQNTRIPYCEKHFLAFCLHYFSDSFSHNLSKYHRQWCNDLNHLRNIMIIGHRDCGKTTWITFFLIWCICYKKHEYIMYYSYKKESAGQRLFQIIRILQQNGRIYRDFGQLFPEGQRSGDKQKSREDIFITTNDIKVEAMSISTSPRGQTHLSKSGKNIRPQLIVFDDVDTIESVRNPEIITQNESFLKNEVLGGVDSTAQLVFLGNVILNDGLVPRFKNHIEGNDNWRLCELPVMIDGEVTWNRYVKTDKEAEEYNYHQEDRSIHKISIESLRRDQGDDEFNANYMLIPMQHAGNCVFSEALMSKCVTPNYKEDEVFPGLRLYRIPSNGWCYYGIDTAQGGERGDYSVIVVRDEKGSLLAHYQGRVNPRILCQVVDRLHELGYNGVICPERQGEGHHFITEAENYNWHFDIHREKKPDTKVGVGLTKHLGFSTTRESKEYIISMMRTNLEQEVVVEYDDRSVSEMRNFYYKDNGSMSGLGSHHDDCVIAEAICQYAMSEGGATCETYETNMSSAIQSYYFDQEPNKGIRNEKTGKIENVSLINTHRARKLAEVTS